MDDTLNEEQLKVISEVQNGNNILLTGGGGVGKSYTIKYIVSKYNNKNIGLCAMTGCAAILIDGTTIHSFMGIGVGEGTIENLVRKASRFKKNFNKLKTLDILIIDEVSMLDKELFDKISHIFQIIKRCTKPFGGIQVILVGDLFQLAPINGEYCFLSSHWDECDIKTFLLTINMRQKDIVFQGLLERLRWGKCSDEDFIILSKMKNTVFPENIIPTRLYSRNDDADIINNRELHKLNSEEHIFYIKAENAIAKNWAVNVAKIQEKLALRINAQVILTYNVNIKIGLVNGARGYVTGFLGECVLVKFANGLEVYVDYISRSKDDEFQISYMPLKLAWAISIHKSQGMSIDALEVDLGNSIFANGQAYTGLSRGRNMESIKITNLLRKSFKTSPAVIAFYNDQ